MSNYFVIHNGDGDTTVEEITKNELLKRLDENYWGDVTPLTSVPGNDTNYWGGDILIIKGEIAIPTAVDVVTKYEIK